MSLQPGQVRAVDLGRRFSIAATRGKSLRGRVFGYEDHSVEDFWALRHVHLEIEPGQSFGIVGRNGSGKSTLLKILARIFGPSEGTCETGGRLSSLLELGAGFHPEFNAVENIYLASAVYGIPKREIERQVDAILAFAEIERFAYQPVKTFSSGMFARLGFAVAMHVKPDILILDEVLAVGDEAFVQKCLGRIGDFRRSGGTMILVTHDPGTVERLCSHATLLERGRQVFSGSGVEVVAEYHRHLIDEEPEPAAIPAPTTVSTEPETSSRETSQDQHPPVPEGEAAEDIDIDVTVSTVDGKAKSRFSEGEPFEIRLAITSRIPIDGASLAVGFREASGFGLGNRSLHDFSLRPNETREVRMAISDPPLRSGMFAIGVRLASEYGDTVYANAEHIADVSIFSAVTDAEGSIRFDATWVDSQAP